MNLLITGSSGFVGKHLVEKLSSTKNLFIFGVDIHQKEVSNKNFCFVPFDLAGNDNYNELPNNIDVIIHLSQSSNYRNFPDKSKDIFNVNINATFKLLEWARNNGVKKFICASTGNVYRQQNKALEEGDECLPIDFYGTSKYSAELLCKQYNSYFKVLILRIFGVYGKGQKNMLIPNLIERIKRKQLISLAQNIGLMINPIYIDDFVDIFEDLINYEQQDNYDILNIGGDEVLSYSQMANIIAKKLDIKLNTDVNQNKPTYLYGSINKMNRLFGKRNFYSFNKGIDVILNS